MLKHRVIPCLLLKDGGLVKTVKFKSPTYIGDPLNAVRIFNDKEVDELIFLDITASLQNKQPDLDFLDKIATECFMPFCYGGGINNIDTIKKLFKLGVEKISLNTAAVVNPKLIKEAANLFGSQAVTISLDIKKDSWGNYRLYIKSGTINTGLDPVIFAQEVGKLGAGEIIVHNIDRDGSMIGYDLDLLKKITKVVKIPIVTLGGAGRLADMKEAVEKTGVSALAAGSLFVYHGKTKGILISYPSYMELENLFKE